MEHEKTPYALLNRLTVAIVVAWTGLVGGSLAWNLHLSRHQTETIALNVASAYFNKDLAFRLWGAKHGGVYVPVTEETRPNPYLSHVPERDISTPSGRALTLINPAYMIRQMMTDFATLTGTTGHLTSLRLLNPDNAPDSWERRNLEAFERGRREATEFTIEDGRPVLRLMRPFITKKPCLKCHAHQGYKVGDVRGATSITIPMAPYLALEAEMRRSMVVSHALIFIFGLAGIAFAFRRIRGNIGRHVEMEEDLRGRNDFIHSIIDSLSHPFMVFDAETHEVALANIAALQGAPVGGRTCYQVSHHRDRPCDGDEHPCPIALVKARKTTVSVEHTHYNGDGEPRIVEIQCYPLFDEAGRVDKVIEYAIDITERREAEREKDTLQKQLQQSQKMEAIGQLSGGVAHDFNNLLTAILGYSEVVLMRLEENHPCRQNVEMIREAGQKAATLTRRLLAFSRKQVMEVLPLHLDALVRDMVKMLGRLLGEDVEIELGLEAGEAVIMGDPAQLEQVVMNLAVNARDAMPGGGKLTFATTVLEVEEGRRVADGTELAAGGWLCFSVRDTGCGMDEETREKLFEPFFTTKEVGKGTGLGLATVYGIVKQHQGVITVESAPGAGAVFTLYFPLAGEDRPRPTGPAAVDSPLAGGSEGIVVVDDEEQIVEFLSQFLAGLGYRVRGFGAPAAALEYITTHPGDCDLLITDVVMPEMNGSELARRARKELPELKVIFMSGYAGDTVARFGIGEAGEAGRYFLQKPVTPSDLAIRVREVLAAS